LGIHRKSAGKRDAAAASHAGRPIRGYSVNGLRGCRGSIDVEMS